MDGANNTTLMSHSL